MTLFDRTALIPRRTMSTHTILLAFTAISGTLAALAPHPATATGFTAAAFAFGVSLVWVTLLTLWRKVKFKNSINNMALLVEHDASCCLISDLDGGILHTNRAASQTLQATQGQTLRQIVGAHVADASGLIHRVQSVALADGISSEKVVLPDRHLRMSAHQLGPAALLWRLELFDAKDECQIQYPALTIGRAGTVLWMNAAARELAGGRVRSLGDLIADSPLRSGQLHQIRSNEQTKGFIVNVHPAGVGREEVVLIPQALPKVESTDTGFEELPVPLLKVSPQGEIAIANRCARDLLHARGDGDRCLSDLMEGLASC